MIDFCMTSKDFRDQYFERRPYLFRHAFSSRPFDWSDLDTLLQENEPTPQGLQLFNHGLIDHESFTEDVPEFGALRRRLNKVRFYGHLGAGATLVINRLEQQSVAARRLCAQVARFAALPATSNAYVSFRGDGTFGKHWDTHDVFAIQLLGRKRWRIFPPTLPLPLSHQTSEASEQRCPDTPVLDCVLEAGQVLYIPRGWWHHVIPFDEGSLHLSVGTYAATLYDYVMWACSHALPQDVRAREAFQGDSPELLAAILESIGAAVRDPRNQHEFQQQIVQRERTTSEFNLGLFADPQAKPLSTATRVMLTSCYPRTSAAPLLVNGVALQLDPLSARLVALLSESRAAAIAELERLLPTATPEAIRRSLLNLCRYELVTIEQR